MDRFSHKKTVAMLGLVVGMTMATTGFAMKHGGMKDRFYATDGAKDPLKNVAGECWNTAGGAPGPKEACGDAMPVKEMMPAAVPPAPKPMPSDSDGDGVNDDRDRCPGTRAGAQVDQYGCEVVANVTIDLVEGEFAFDSAELRDGTKAALDDLADQIKASPGNEMVTVVGHTDSTGPEAYNQGLSERRAQSAADYLESQGINDVQTKGMGETQPIADNGTREGRAANRRIEVTTN